MQAVTDDLVVNGEFGTLDKYPGNYGRAFNFTSVSANALSFSVDSSGHLFTIFGGINLYASQPSTEHSFTNIFFNTADDMASGNFLYVDASIVDGVVKLKLGSNDETMAIFGDAMYLGNAADETMYKRPVNLMVLGEGGAPQCPAPLRTRDE
jgi:hypothetical protein